MEITIEGNNLFNIIVNLLFQLMAAAGYWKLFVKCGFSGWWGLLPGFRTYKLGQCADRTSDGIKVIILGLIVNAGNFARNLYDDESRAEYIISAVTLVAALILLIYSIRIYSGLCQVFGKKKWWILLWTLFEGLAALIWGFSDKFQPIHKNTDFGDERLAGTTPVEFETGPGVPDRPGSHAEKAEQGLLVHLRERTVLDGLVRRYLLKDIHLFIPDGSLVLLLGGSGSGKSTFVNAVTGYEKADADMVLHGRNIYKEYDQMKYRIGFVPQTDLLRMNDTVKNTLEDAAQLRLPVQVSRQDTRKRIENVMETLGLNASQNGLVSKKSGGQKKRISIGMELISDPDLFLLDEPDSGLDGVIARELFEKLRSIADEGKIVIAITHTPDRVIDLFDKVIVLAKDSGKVGRLAFYGSPEEAKAFFGKNSMEEVVMSVNRKNEGGEGRADEFIEKFAALRTDLETIGMAPDEAPVPADAASPVPETVPADDENTADAAPPVPETVPADDENTADAAPPAPEAVPDETKTEGGEA